MPAEGPNQVLNASVILSISDLLGSTEWRNLDGNTASFLLSSLRFVPEDMFSNESDGAISLGSE